MYYFNDEKGNIRKHVKDFSCKLQDNEFGAKVNMGYGRNKSSQANLI